MMLALFATPYRHKLYLKPVFLSQSIHLQGILGSKRCSDVYRRTQSGLDIEPNTELGIQSLMESPSEQLWPLRKTMTEWESTAGMTEAVGGAGIPDNRP
ncbi:unnamed protein product [Caretta caretta]